MNAPCLRRDNHCGITRVVRSETDDVAWSIGSTRAADRSLGRFNATMRLVQVTVLEHARNFLPDSRHGGTQPTRNSDGKCGRALSHLALKTQETPKCAPHMRALHFAPCKSAAPAPSRLCHASALRFRQGAIGWIGARVATWVSCLRGDSSQTHVR